MEDREGCSVLFLCADSIFLLCHRQWKGWIKCRHPGQTRPGQAVEALRVHGLFSQQIKDLGIRISQIYVYLCTLPVLIMVGRGRVGKWGVTCIRLAYMSQHRCCLFLASSAPSSGCQFGALANIVNGSSSWTSIEWCIVYRPWFPGQKSQILDYCQKQALSQYMIFTYFVQQDNLQRWFQSIN